MKVSEYVASYLATISPRVYGICGAGAMHLNDAICNHPQIEFIAMHHEQAATYAAECDARVTGNIGIVHVTAGPGGTNTITGLAAAYVDSIPLLVIAGQVTASTMVGEKGLRQLGTNELDLVGMIKPVTKYAVTVTDPASICHHLERAVHEAMTGRRGPVFVEIPLDVQATQIVPSNLEGFDSDQEYRYIPPIPLMSAFELLKQAERPIIIAGNGVRLAGARLDLLAFIEEARIPLVTSWGGADLIPSDHHLNIGRMGILGSRAANFAVQNADLILAIGTRLSIPQIGHATHLFARNAKLIVVDIDHAELTKPTIDVDLPIVADAKAFLAAMNAGAIALGHPDDSEWVGRCRRWKQAYPVMQPEYRESPDGVNSYAFVEELAKHLDDDAIIVTDVGAGFISAFQSMPLRGSQRLIHSAGVSAMGWGLPAAIGAAKAAPGRQVVCLTGDGGTMLNLQEMQTIAHHDLPVSIFVFCNNAYMTMQYTQDTHFKREAASSPKSGVSCPDFYGVAHAFGIRAAMIKEQRKLGDIMYVLLWRKPIVCEVHMPEKQLLIPRVATRMQHGVFVPATLEDMYPYLPRDEFHAQMVAELAGEAAA